MTGKPKVTVTVPALFPVTVGITCDSAAHHAEILAALGERILAPQIVTAGTTISVVVPSDCVEIVEGIVERLKGKFGFDLVTVDGTGKEATASVDGNVMFEIAGTYFVDPVIVFRLIFRAKTAEHYLSNDLATPLVVRAKVFFEERFGQQDTVIPFGSGFLILTTSARVELIREVVTSFASANGCASEITTLKEVS